MNPEPPFRGCLVRVMIGRVVSVVVTIGVMVGDVHLRNDDQRGECKACDHCEVMQFQSSKHSMLLACLGTSSVARK